MMRSLTFCRCAFSAHQRAHSRHAAEGGSLRTHLGNLAISAPRALARDDVPLLGCRDDDARLVDLLLRELHVARQLANFDSRPCEALGEFCGDFGREGLERSDVDDLVGRGWRESRWRGKRGERACREIGETAEDRKERNVGFTLSSRQRFSIFRGLLLAQFWTNGTGGSADEHVLVGLVPDRVDDRLQPVERFVSLWLTRASVLTSP